MLAAAYLGDVEPSRGRFGRTWTDAQLRTAIAASRNFAEVCAKLGLTSQRNRVVVERTRTLGLDTMHFTSQTTRGEKRQNAVTLDDILTNKRPFESSYVKKRLLKAGLLTYHCYECKLVEWRGKPLTLELDHIDGNNQNNALNNLRLLCPNCHAQTPTFRGRNITQRMTKTLVYRCEKCEKQISCGARFCRSCAPKRSKPREWPPDTELQMLVETLGPLATSRRLGVSRHVLHEHLQQMGSPA